MDRAIPQIAAILMVVASASRLDAQSVPRDTLPAYTLEGVTVTSTRSPVARASIPQKVEVISEGELARSGARDAGEALRRTTPVDVIEFPGLLTGVSIRGFRPQYSGTNPRTLILVDGRPAGTNNLALLPVADLERIEVLRGPASALYGPSAMGGVVNLITRHSTGALDGAVAVEYSGQGEYEGTVRAGGNISPRLDFDASFGALGRNRGYRTGSNRTFGGDSLLKKLPDGSGVRLPWISADTILDFAEYRSLSGSARLGYTIDESWRAELRAERYRGDDVQNPGDLGVTEWDSRSLKDVRRGSVDLGITGEIRRHTPSIRLYATNETVDYYNAPERPHFVNFRTPVRTLGAQLQNAINFGRGTLILGTDYTTTEAESEAFTADGGRGSPFTPNTGIRTAAAFGQARVAFLDQRLVASAGARFDHVTFSVRETPNLGGFPPNQERHAVFTPSGGLRVHPGGGIQLYGNVGRAFVTPHAFNVAGYSEQRAGPDRGSVFVTRGNPELRPETSRSWDLGVLLSRPAAGLEIEATYFATSVRDRIATTLVPGSGTDLTTGGDTILSTTTYRNVDEAVISGIEARFTLDVGAAFDLARSIRLFSNATGMLEAEEHFLLEGATRRIRNVADLTVLAGVEYDDLRHFSGRVSGRYVGDRVDSDYIAWWQPGEVRYPAYLVFDVSAAIRIDARYRIGIDLENATDEEYFEVRGYNLPGRSLSVSVGATL